MDKNEIERLHNSGQMPDWYYYQVNGKSAAENLWEQHQKQMDKLRNRQQIDRELELYKARRKAEIDKEIEEQIETELTGKLEEALDELLKDWQ